MDEVLSNKEIFQNVVKALKMTVRQFALRMGVSYQRVFDLYSGRTVNAAPEIIEAMCKTYGISERYATLGIGAMFVENVQTSQPNTVVIQEHPSVREPIRKEPSKSKAVADPEESHEDVVVDPLAKIVVSLTRQAKEKDAYIRKLEDLLKANNIEF